MRALIAIVVIVLVLLLIGWLRFSTPDGDPTIQMDTDKMKQDTSAIVDETKDAAEEISESVDEDVKRE